jgi:uncharacterized protein (TIGR03032 family)
MRLDTPFVRLPLLFDAERLAAEVARLPEADWRPHPQGLPGNWALALVAVGGDPANDGTSGPMHPTPLLARCPYLQQVLAAFGSVIGRTRLMRLDGNAEAAEHADTNYYWMERARVHVPILTTPSVRFRCGGRETHMAAGEAWIFDTWSLHSVVNPEPTRRIHLVADTVGSAAFWDLVERGARPFASPPRLARNETRVDFDPALSPSLRTEGSNFPALMSPWEQEALLRRVRDDLEAAAGAPEARLRLEEVLQRFQRDWRGQWAADGEGGDREAWRGLVERLDAALQPLAGVLQCSNGVDAVEMVRQAVVSPALRTAGAAVTVRGATARPARALFDRPIFIVAPPRSGTAILFETLAQAPGLWTIGKEGRAVFEGVPSLRPDQRGFESNRLLAADAQPDVVQALEGMLLAQLRDREGNRPPEGARGLRLLETTPRNALRIPFLASAFPDALFLYVFRDPRQTISTSLAAWQSERFVTYPDLPGWDGPPWSLLLVPGWRELRGLSLPEIAARQWEITTRCLLDDLEALPAERWCVVSYDALIENPQAEAERLCGFLGLAWDRERTERPRAPHARPDPDEWERHAAAVDGVLPHVQAGMERARDLFARPPKVAGAAAPAAAAADLSGAGGPDALRSVHTTSFPQVLSQLGVSLLVSTYQSGRVIVLRVVDGVLNTHFRTFKSPMGMAQGGTSLAIGTERHVWLYRNVPAVLPPGPHDACFLPYRTHVTGDIRVHELAFAGEELWLVNTRFSCLCTLDAQHSFVPRWRPPFVTALSADDRCHLNGLAVVRGQPRYVTALGRTDSAAGWRERKARGGVVVDVPSGEILAAELSMPHSPRWHEGSLYVLESGGGTLARVDLASGRLETIARLPGFTRGLACVGPLAFVGLSQVRESNHFGGLPITESREPRYCGVWIVHLESGSVVGFVRFEDAVQEIFDVQLLSGLRFPELGEPESDLIANTYVLPPEALAEVART